ncbi:MAG: NAD(P)-dependent glycerol-1-phosphate dehydrogenase [Candidatus Thermoplasmatota archaeon]|nr:NAD(P)-dependent glycerol-1-phosphate dehydrogenase [Candidatus Thermoplasmatota archaeon]
MELPRGILIKRGAILEVGNVCRNRFHLSGRGLIVCDPITEEIAGKAVEASLSDSGYETDIIRIEGATDRSVEIVNEYVEEHGKYFILGVGGGRPIDVAKYVATIRGLDFISVPTAASHDGIASSRSSIEMDGRKRSIKAVAPLGVIADLSIIAGSPYRLLASGSADIISNYTAVLDWRLAHRLKGVTYSDYAAALSEMTAKLVLERAAEIRPGLEESVRIVVKALVSSSVAMSIAGSSRPASGSEHMFAHSLDLVAERPALHGEEAGVGTIMMMYLHGGDWKRIRDALSILGAPINAEELGVKDDEVISALLQAHRIRPERYTILGTGIEEKAARKIALVTGVISH